MSAEAAFSIANTTALASWILLAVLPRQRWVSHLLTALVVPALFSAGYVALIATRWAGASGGFSRLAGVAALFGDPWLLLAGWMHYLAFDLLVGSWEVRDAQARGVPHLLVVPCLFLTFVFGPAGWLLYTALTRSPRFTADA
jgi:hypothetical protein